MSKTDKYPTQIQVTGKEKRHRPTKHYVFIVQVRWSDGSKVPIYRQYSDFHQLHTDLQEITNKLPENERKVVLPTFPAKKAFERAEISKAASVRRHAFDGYLKGLLDYDVLAKSKVIKEFFMPTSEDINPAEPAQSERRKSSILTALSELFPKKDNEKAGLKKSRSGVDLSSQYKEEEDPIYVSSPLMLETYLVLADYTPQEKGEVQLKEGHFIQVIEKHTTGWWFLSTEYGDGWGPATHLQPLDGDENDEPEPIYSGSKYITTNSHEAEADAKDEISFPEGALIDVLHKLMDGWWVIKYQGEVGYAPATFLSPFKNPHFKESRYGLRQNKRPTTRRTALKNSHGKSVSSLRDRSRDLSIYKKLSATKNKEEAAEVAKKVMSPSVRFKADVEREIPLKSPSGNEGKPVVKKLQLQRTLSNDSYEYIDVDDMDTMEDITSWVDVNTLKKKQSEEVLKRDYMNVPKITVTDSVGDTSPPIQNDNTQSDKEVLNSAPPPPPNSRPKSTTRLESNSTSTSDDSCDSDQVVKEDASHVKSATEADNLDGRLESKAENSDFEHPAHIATILQSIHKKRINRIYTNDRGEMVIQFADPQDAASFGVCDIREDTCPVTEPEPNQTPEVPGYSKVNKQRHSGQYDNADKGEPETGKGDMKKENNKTNQSDSSSDEGKPEIPSKT